MKKLKHTLLGTAMMILSANTFAQVVDGGTTGSLTWQITGTYPTYTLTISGNDTMPNYTASNMPWYSYRSTIKTIVIDSGVTTIGDYAFYYCSVTSVTIPNNVTTIGDYAFYYCSVTSVTIPNNVKTIGKEAFRYAAMTSLTIGDSVTSIGEVAFANCRSLHTVNYNAINCTTMGKSGSWVFLGDTALRTLNISNKAKNIPPLAFYMCKTLTSVIIPNSVATIGDCAFQHCIGLTSVTIGNSVTSIGNYAFSYCSGLTSITIPNSVTTIGYQAFWGCSGLTSVTFGNSVATIGNEAFGNCSGLTSITIPNSVVTIGNAAFGNCSGLTSITIPNSVTTIGYQAFWGCSGLTTVNFNADSCHDPDPYSYLSWYTYPVFGNCTSFKILNIGNNVKIIPEATFYNCSSLTSVTIPNSVTTIGRSAFYNCSGLDSVTIGNSVATIGKEAFYNCSGLSSVTSNAITPPILGNNVFSYVPSSISVYIPCGTYSSYSNAWNYFSNFIVMGSVTADTTFYNAIKCYNVPYTDNNFTMPIYQAGVYYAILLNSTGCDSVVCLILTENPYIPVTNYSASVCQGNSYSDEHFTNLTNEGKYYKTLPNINGCDSIVCLTLSYPVSPVQQLCMISVDENNHNEIVWKVEEKVVSYNIYREGNTSGQYGLVANIGYNSQNKWIDTASDAKIRSYRYKVSGIDTCGKESVLSSPHKTMHLTINAGQNNSWNLIWTAYEGTAYSTYNIYRTTGKNPGPWLLIGTMPSGNTSYSDFSAPNGNFVYYMVEIVLDEPCVLKKDLSSIKSNIATNNPGLETSKTYIIQGKVTHNDNPLGGVSIGYAGGSVVSNSSGEYSVTVDSNATVTLTPSLSGYTFTPPNHTYTHVVNDIPYQDFIATTDVGIVGANNIRPIKIYPNPTNGQLRVSGDISDGKDIQIYDVVGQVVFTSHLSELSPETTIDISHLANGLYFLKVDGRTVKIVKE